MVKKAWQTASKDEQETPDWAQMQKRSTHLVEGTGMGYLGGI